MILAKDASISYLLPHAFFDSASKGTDEMPDHANGELTCS